MLLYKFITEKFNIHIYDLLSITCINVNLNEQTASQPKP